MRIVLGLEYDGGAFCGWQSQPDGGGVQDAVERALAEVAGCPVRTFAAGRTDAGVHAAMQVVHFVPPVSRPLSAWLRGTNAALDRAAAVLWAHAAPDDFHARFSARARRYQYFILNREHRPSLLRGKVGWVSRPLDAEKMDAAARLLEGRRDFSAFRAASCQAKSPVCDLRRFRVTRRGEWVAADFVADAFLQRMARNLAAALVPVGRGLRPPEWVLAEVLSRRVRRPPPLSPGGLYLVGADYAPEWGFPPTFRPPPIPGWEEIWNDGDGVL